MLRTTLLTVVTAVALAAPVGMVTSSTAATPAARASEVVLTDAGGDVWTYSEGTATWELWGTKADADVLGATVKHRAKTIQVVMTFDNLRKKRPQNYTAKIKTKKLAKTAYVYANKRAAGWGGKHGLQHGVRKVPAPGFTHEIDYQADTVVMNLPRKLFKEPRWIKVQMQNTMVTTRWFTENPHNSTHEPAFTAKIYKP
jgi:hypothetical protein